MNEYVCDFMGGGEELFNYVKVNLLVEFVKRFFVYIIFVFVDFKFVGFLVCLEGFFIFVCKLLLNIYDVIVFLFYCGKGLLKLML